MDIRDYLDSTYLKTAAQAGITEDENLQVVKKTVDEAITEGFKLVMIRPEMVKMACGRIADAGSKLLVGTVIDFPEGKNTSEAKIQEAAKAVEDGADELDFVLDYERFRAGETAVIRQQVLDCTRYALQHNKTVKWIIEVAALNDHEIVQLCVIIKNTVLSYFDEEMYARVFVKSSTGFYVTKDGRPNGATVPAIKLMLENSFPLQVKAAGGVRTTEETLEMIALGVKRIGTSSAKAIAGGSTATGAY